MLRWPSVRCSTRTTAATGLACFIFRFLRRPHKGHWLFQTQAINCEKIQLQINANSKASGHFFGNFVYATVHIVDQMSVTINGKAYSVNDPSFAVIQDGKHVIYLSESAYVGTALEHASDYQDEFNTFMEDDFDKDTCDLDNLRSQLLGELPQLTIQKSLASSGLCNAVNCELSTTVVLFKSTKQVVCEPLQFILEKFMAHQNQQIDQNALASFITQLTS